jgi:prepilin-type N-terminal cleavage/methylation domain-containing protein
VPIGVSLLLFYLILRIFYYQVGMEQSFAALSRANNRLVRRKRGFTLTEIAIVLGVIGIILSAIWAAASSVYQNLRTQQAVQEVQIIVAGYRSLYSVGGVDDSNWADVTCKGIIDGLFPQQTLLSGTTCANASTTPSQYPQHPWGSSIVVYAYRTSIPQGIAVGLFNLDQESCARFANQTVGQPDILWEDVNGTQQYLPPEANNVPYTTSQVTTACGTVADGQFVLLMFKAR